MKILLLILIIGSIATNAVLSIELNARLTCQCPCQSKLKPVNTLKKQQYQTKYRKTKHADEDTIALPNSSEDDEKDYDIYDAEAIEEANLIEGPDQNPRCETSDDWVRKYPACRGLAQSPINIKVSNVQLSYKKVAPLCWKNYDAIPIKTDLVNTGQTIQMNGTWRPNETPTVSCGVLGNNVYEFVQWHCHWAKTNRNGSEHTFNGKSFPMECHFVHFNKKYGTLEKASLEKDGLAVIGYIYDIESPATFPADVLGSALLKLVKRDRVSVLPLPLGTYARTFSDTYVTYHGSLTTPPCSESVVWIINIKKQRISSLLMKKFRCVAKTSECLINNFRQPQELNGRDILLVKNFNH